MFFLPFAAQASAYSAIGEDGVIGKIAATSLKAYATYEAASLPSIVPVHGAAVIGDTVGDPCKDTSGPSLNILIKLMSMVAIVFAPVIVKFAPVIQQWLGMVK